MSYRCAADSIAFLAALASSHPSPVRVRGVLGRPVFFVVVIVIHVHEVLHVVTLISLARLAHGVPVTRFEPQNSEMSMREPHAKAGAWAATWRSRLTIAAALAG